MSAHCAYAGGCPHPMACMAGAIDGTVSDGCAGWDAPTKTPASEGGGGYGTPSQTDASLMPGMHSKSLSTDQTKGEKL